MARIVAENADIWREIAELRGRLQAVAMPFCQSEAEAEDLVSRTVERAVGNAAKYDAAKGDLFVWMRTILVNIALIVTKRLADVYYLNQ